MKENSGITTLRNLLEDSLFAAYEKKQEQWRADHPNGKLYPSVSDFGKCPRQVGYSLMNTPISDPPTADSLANFALGGAAEEALAEMLVGALSGREVRVEIPWLDSMTTGRTDFLVAHPNIQAVIELKSTKQRQVPYLPQPDHKRQLRGYLYAGQRGKLEGFPIDKCDIGYLVYFIKDAVKGTPVFHIFAVEANQELTELDLQRNYEIAKYVEGGRLPDRPLNYKRNKFPCSYCSWKTTCYGSPQPV